MSDRPIAWVIGVGGIGAALVERLSELHTVVCFDIEQAATDAAFFLVDASDRAAFTEAAAEAYELHGAPDVFVVAAGRVSYLSVEAATPEDVTALLTDNLILAINVLHTVYNLGPERRRICVLVASNAAFTPRPGQSIYAAAKAAITSLVGSLAVGWAAAGIRVFGIAPGTVLVDRNRARVAQQYPSAPLDPSRPGGRLVQPAEIAEFVAALLPHADHLTGQVIVYDGGSTLTVRQ